MLLQPYDMEVGAGTFHPATTLRARGPKPWNAAYVQPSRRPKDGRYGENPNRLYKHLQFQVILKPAPVDIQGIYLKSLAAIGPVISVSRSIVIENVTPWPSASYSTVPRAPGAPVNARVAGSR